MKIKVVLLLIMILVLQHPKPVTANIGEKIVSSTAKTMVKAYIALTNLEKTKKKLISKLEKIDYDEYNTRYAKLYEILKDLPGDIKSTYKITPGMSKVQMAKNIQSVDKRKIYEIINSIPDKTVTGLFKSYLNLK